MGQERNSHPRFGRSGPPPPLKLTADDAAILRYVHRFRFVRADDLYRLFGDRSSDRLSRRLTLLYRGGYLDRPIAQIEKFRGGGSQPLVYGLDGAGARYLKETFGVRLGPTDWRARNRRYTRESLDHTLLVSRFLVDLEISCRHHHECTAISLDDILEGAPEETQTAATPGRWPVPVNWLGRRASIHVVPDAIFGLRRHAGTARAQETYLFLEMDRGTMTISPSTGVQESDGFLYRATILRKLLCYAESHRQGVHAAHLGIPSARVLTLTTSHDRAETMRAVALESVVRALGVPAGLFLFGTVGDSRNLLSAGFVDAAKREIRLAPPGAA